MGQVADGEHRLNAFMAVAYGAVYDAIETLRWTVGVPQTDRALDDGHVRKPSHHGGPPLTDDV